MEVQQAAEVRQLNRRVTQRAGYTETAPFSADPYAHHWLEKRLA